MAKLQKTPAAKPLPPLQARFTPAQVQARFHQLFGQRLLRAWLKAAPATFYQRCFTPLVTLWYLVFQRLDHNHTLAQVLTDARGGGADALSPRGQPLSTRLRSDATAAFSDARQRLPLAVLHQALTHSAEQIGTWVKNSCWHGWRVILLDGSTVRLRAWGNIPKAFPPHRGRTGPTYWCLMRVVAGFCLTTGVAVATAMGASTASEQALAAPLLVQLGANSLVVADRNFGVFSLVQAAFLAQVQVLARLTQARARKLARDNGFGLRRQLDRPAAWTASPHDQAHPDSPEKTVAGRLLALPVHRRGFRPQVLYLFTTLRATGTYPAQALLDLYGRRWQVEVNLRCVKTELELGALECKSAEMARKEWVAGLLAYNVIRSLMVAAAAHAGCPLGTLSFSRARLFLLHWLVPLRCRRTKAAAARWFGLLQLLAQCRQPQRRRPRPPEPRALRYFRPPFPPLKGDRGTARGNILPKPSTKS